MGVVCARSCRCEKKGGGEGGKGRTYLGVGWVEGPTALVVWTKPDPKVFLVAAEVSDLVLWEHGEELVDQAHECLRRS
jgi:hypothetical protein